MTIPNPQPADPPQPQQADAQGQQPPAAATPKPYNRGNAGKGRPTLLNADVQTRICNALRTGNYREAAARYGGISMETFTEWMARGEGREKNRKPNAAYVQFALAVHQAEADAEIAIVAQWRAQIPQDWRAARDMLARRHPSRWGPKQNITVRDWRDEVVTLLRAGTIGPVSVVSELGRDAAMPLLLAAGIAIERLDPPTDAVQRAEQASADIEAEYAVYRDDPASMPPARSDFSVTAMSGNGHLPADPNALDDDPLDEEPL